jgi:hypothetical protein
MKKVIKSITLLLLATAATAQNRMLPKLVYDFSKGHFLDNEYVKDGRLQPMPFGSFAVVEVINVNTFRYRVEISGRSVDYVTQMPSELQAIFRQPKTSGNTAQGQEKVNAGANQANSLVNEANANAAKNALPPATQIALTTANRALLDKNPRNDENANNVLQAFAVQMEQADASSQLADLMKQIAEACQKYTSVVQKVATIKFSRAELINISKQDWPDYQSMQNSMPTELNREEMRGNFENFTRYYANIQALFNQSILLNISPEEREKIKAAKKLIDDGHQLITEDNYLKLIDDVYTLQEAMSIAKSFTVTSPPVQIEGDVVAFDIKAAPVKVNDLLNHTAEKSFKVEIPTKGGLKVDFSVGPVFSFGRSAKDDLYFLEPNIAKDSVTLTSRSNNNVVSPGIAAMMHAYGRTGRSAALGGCFGVGANVENFDNVKASFYLGGSAIFGKRQKLAVSAGFSFLKVARLKETEFETRKYKIDAIKLSDVTEKVFKLSGFLSVSYNLTTRTEVK